MMVLPELHHISGQNAIASFRDTVPDITARLPERFRDTAPASTRSDGVHLLIFQATWSDAAGTFIVDNLTLDQATAVCNLPVSDR